MLSTSELRMFKIFSQLKDEDIDKIISITSPAEFESDSVVFKEGEPAEHIYLVTSGKILLEQRITSKMTVTVDTLKSGDVFGTASIMDITNYTTDASVSEKSSVLVLNSNEFSNLMAQNPEIGFKVLKSLSVMMKKQLTERTDLFVRSISSHPDFDTLD